ncbi:MAG: NUDIX hydrolase [Bacilli bacterium]|nr:NUDIX hydrolase [Bacilli bacterium]
MNFNNKIEVLINLFTFDKGEIKILLFKKQDEPFKGYWMLPSNLMLNRETLEECADATLKERVGVTDIYKETCNVFSDVDRIPDTRIVGISIIGIVDTVKANIGFNITEEAEWFNINNIPKTIYDNGIIIEESVNKLKKELLNTKLLKIFFPSDFTLPELQKLYEQVLNKKLDRRNFRKKILKLGIIEDTMDKNISMTGRPAKLYRFKDIDDKDLF